MWDVIAAHDAGRIGVRDGAGVRSGFAEVVVAGLAEAAFEPAPADALLVQQIADVEIPGIDRLRLVARAAEVACGLGIADHRATGGHGSADDVGGRVEIRPEAVGLARGEIDGAHRRGAERRAIGVVVQREALRVVPEGGHGVAVVVAHHESRALAVVAWQGPAASVVQGHGSAAADLLDELVHQARVGRGLLVVVVVILIARLELRTVEPEGLRRVHVARIQERLVQPVDGRGPREPRGTAARLQSSLRSDRSRSSGRRRRSPGRSPRRAGSGSPHRCQRAACGGGRRRTLSTLLSPRQAPGRAAKRLSVLSCATSRSAGGSPEAPALACFRDRDEGRGSMGTGPVANW